MHDSMRWRSTPAGKWITPRSVALVGVIVALLFAAQSCQRSQVRLTQSQAVTVALKQVTFTPTDTQVRLVRQGLNSHPYWAVSLSIPRRIGQDRNFSELTVVRVDANTGVVAAVTRPLGK